MLKDIQLKNINKEFQGVPVLNNINLLFNEGDFISVVGPSGSGKSTLLSILGTLDKPTNGAILFKEEDITSLNSKRLSEFRSQHVGFVFQQYNLLPTLNSLENVLLPTIPKKNKIDKIEKAKMLLTDMGLENKLSSFPSQLSGGQQQRVAIARALINEPDWILADEPTGNLDSKTSLDMFQLLKKLNKEKKCGVIFVTHDINLANMSNRTIELQDGVVITDKKRIPL
ncbi:ABC transporter ATP-binding protein [Bacillus infantis]|uniref:ABC transporter ATP-binding protein n=1 Tax=Bacillus infantis TaxID=324767 RepID=UPI003CF3DFC2